MLLSVIIPVFNGENFIHQAYQALMDQDLDDFEILYVDNHSTDESVAIIRDLCRVDNRVHLFHQSVQGAGPTRNLGIQKATGKYIYLFDVDDELYPHALNRMISVLEQYPEAWAVVGKMVKSGQNILETEKPKDETGEVSLVAPPDLGLLWFSDLKTVVGPPAFLYRKEVFEEIGLYPEALRIGQDTAFDIRLGMQCCLAQLDSYVYLYRKHAVSTTQKVKKQDNLLFHTWRRLTLEHLPYFRTHEVPKRFEEILFRQLYNSMGKLVCLKEGFKERLEQIRTITYDFNPLRMPFYIRWYLFILAIFPYSFLLKFYVYYLSNWYVNFKLKRGGFSKMTHYDY